MNQPRFAPGDTGFDSGLGFFGVANWTPIVRYPDSMPYPLLGKDPWPEREAIAIEHFRAKHYVPSLVKFTPPSALIGKNYVDPVNTSEEAVAQAAAYPYWPGAYYSRYAGMQVATYEDWLRGYMNPPEGTQVSLRTVWNRPDIRWQSTTGAFIEMASTAALVGGAIVLGPLVAGAGATGTGAATAGVAALPTASTVVAAPAVATVAAGTGITSLGVTAAKTVAGLAVSKTIATVVAPKPTAPVSAAQSAQVQANMAAQLQAAQASQGANPGLLLAGGLLLIKILL
jgi:hypothetical protein